MNTPTIGRIVQYRLTASDASEIDRRRTTRNDIADRIASGSWPMGAQAHLGNPVREGDVYPAIIVSVWDAKAGTVNLRVLLDGTDEFWATSRCESLGVEPHPLPGHWGWPPR